MIDTDVYLRWLEGQVRHAGCHVIERKLDGLLREEEDRLARDYHVSTVVNCAGLGAGELAGDKVYPFVAQLIRVRNDGKKMPRVTQAIASHIMVRPASLVLFSSCRTGTTCLSWAGWPSPTRRASTSTCTITSRSVRCTSDCCEFMPALENAEIDAAEPVRVGLRPVRPRNVRLETEAGTRIVHNYGHGGSGVTLSWGCALEVVERVENLTTGNTVTPSPPFAQLPASPRGLTATFRAACDSRYNPRASPGETDKTLFCQLRQCLWR